MDKNSLTDAEKEAARLWLYQHNGNSGGGLGGLWKMIERIAVARVRAAEVRAWEEGMYFGRFFEQEGRGHAPIINPYDEADK